MKSYKDNFEVLGKKVGMTQVYSEDNKLIPVTVVQVGPCPVVELKSQEKHGYEAVQIAFEEISGKSLGAGELGHLKKAGLAPHAKLKEFRVEDTKPFTVGESIKVDSFVVGEKVDVTSNTKGRGFQGVVKRHGFSGGPASHGSMTHRRGGSYGNCQWPGEVMKGKKMPGHMGNTKKTVQNLEIVRVMPEKNLLLVKGSFPGYNGALVTVRKAIKRKDKAGK